MAPRRLISASVIISLIIISVLAVAPSGHSQEPEFPHVEASKTVTPDKVVQGQTIQFKIQLRGAGGLIQTPVDVVLILDRSGSMTGRKFSDAQAAAITFLNYTDSEDRAGLVTYANTLDSIDLAFMDSAGKTAYIKTIKAKSPGGATDMYDAIARAEELLLASPRINAPTVIVLLTDGLHNYPSILPNSAFEAQAQDAKTKGIIIYTIGLGHDVDKNLLRLIAETTEGEFFFAATSDQLLEIYKTIGQKLSFAGTNIKVTETVPSHITYNDDASKPPAEITADTLVWNVGTLRVGQEWAVTYSAVANLAVQVDPNIVQAKVEYITAQGSSAIINLTPGIIYHSIGLSDFTVEPEKVERGKIVTAQVNVQNKGLVQDSFELRTQYDSTVLDSRTVTLNAGESVQINFNWNTTGVESGKYNLTITADPAEQIWESDRSDNQVSQQIEVWAPAGNLWILVVIVLLVMMLTTGGVAYVKMKPVGPTEVSYSCPKCRAPLQYNPRVRQWYCYRCRRYYRETGR